MQHIRGLALVFLAVLVLTGACAKIPEEAVTLSVTVGKDLEEVHKSHRALVERYFGRMKADINAFIDDTYRPFIVKQSLTKGTTIRRVDGSKVTISPWQALASEVKKPGGGRIVERMDSVVRKITAQVAKKRAEFLLPIEDQQREVMRAIDDSYSRIQAAHAIVTGHLSSVRKVAQAQQDVLEKTGLKDVRRKFIDTTAGVSDSIADLTIKARRGELKLDEALEKVRSVLISAKETLASFKAAAKPE